MWQLQGGEKKWNGVKVTQSCPTVCDPIDCAVPGFSRPEYWRSPPPRDLPNPGIEPRSPALRADSLLAEPQGKPGVRRPMLLFHSTFSAVEYTLLVLWPGWVGEVPTANMHSWLSEPAARLRKACATPGGRQPPTLVCVFTSHALMTMGWCPTAAGPFRTWG